MTMVISEVAMLPTRVSSESQLADRLTLVGGIRR